MAAQYEIMRFAKDKGPEISGIEVLDERTKEKYVSNPDVDTSLTQYNFHLIEPKGRYREDVFPLYAENPGSFLHLQKRCDTDNPRICYRGF